MKKMLTAIDKTVVVIILFLIVVVTLAAITVMSAVPEIFRSTQVSQDNQAYLEKIKNELLNHTETSHNLTHELLVYDINLSKFQDKVLRDLTTVLDNIKNISIVNQKIVDDIKDKNQEFRKTVLNEYLNDTSTKINRMNEKLNLISNNTIVDSGRYSSNG